ncbi:MAG: hypothetical protein RIK85_06045 [Marinobacter sp.]
MAGVKNMKSMGRIRKFIHDSGRLKPYYRSWSNVAAGLGVILGSGLWYFVLVPALATAKGIDLAGYAQPDDPTALFAVLIFLLFAVSIIGCYFFAFLVLVFFGKLELADVMSVVFRLRYPPNWVNF